MDSINTKEIKKVFSRIGWALGAILVITSLMQSLWFAIPDRIWGLDNWFTGSSWGMWLGTFAPAYLIGIPVGLLLLKPIPGEAPQQSKLGGKNFWIFVPITIFFMYSGNLIGTFLSMLLSGGQANNALLDYAMDSNPIKILVFAVLAPVIEEYIFRKLLIDRTRKYGEKMAVFLSALAFGLFHGNLFQFFYAFALGWLFAYIYMRTGRLRYSIILHSIINTLGSVISPAILSMLDLEALGNMDVNATAEELMAQFGDMLPGLVAYLLYSIVFLGLAITGLVFLILKCRKLVWREAQCQLPKPGAVKTVYVNAGMIVFFLICLCMMILSL